MQHYFLQYVILFLLFSKSFCKSNTTSEPALDLCNPVLKMPNLFIEDGTLDVIPFDSNSSIFPNSQCNCENGNTYFWKPINESMPYAARYNKNLAYSINSVSTCNLCVCIEAGTCYTPIDNSSYQIDFMPYCTDDECHMYGIVYHQPYFPGKSFIDQYGNIYQGLPPFLEPITASSQYLKISSISCNGCQNLLKPRTCYNQSKYLNDNQNKPILDLHMPFTLTQVIIITASFGCIGAVSTFIYVFVLIVLKTTKDLWKHPVYKLMFHLGIFATIDIWLQTYYASSWGIWYGPYSRRFVIAGLNMISFGISSFTFALALNRWDVIAKPDRLRFIKGDFVSLFLTVLTYLLATGFFVWQSLPGWGRFMVHLNTQYGPYYLQVREYQNLTEYFIQVDIEQGLMVASIVLYVWCITAIIYKRYATGTKLANNEKFLFVQTLTPCIVRVIADGISMYITTSDNWFLILTSAMFFFEACHYPFLYLIFNKTIRFYLSRFFFKNTTSVSIMKGVATQAWASK